MSRNSSWIKISVTMKVLLIAMTCLLFTFSIADANDTTARVGAGGIIFLKSEEIRLLQEELELSTKSVKVSYRFLNESDADIHTTVAFPMPVYGWNDGESAMDANVRPLTSFKVWVDGHLVKTKKHRKAVIGEVDVTDKLRKIGLTEKQIFQTFGDCTIEGCGISKAKIAKVEALDKKNSFPQWKIAETVYWEQDFPKNKEIHVKHEYTPFVGYVYSYPYQSRWRNEMAVIPKDDKEACIDKNTRKAIVNKVNVHAKKGASMIGVNIQDVEYILGTGRNWKGTIGDFKLKIKKESPNQLISTCFPGEAKRINPLLIEFTHKDFVPQDKLVVYFIDVFTAQ